MNTERKYRLLGTAIAACVMALAGCGGGDAVVVGGSLFTSAPSALTLDAGSSSSFKVNGGNLPYTASSGNANIAKASVSGGSLSVTAVAPGTTSVTVVDALGSRLSFEVTVLAQGQGGVALSLTPGELTVSNCTTRIPFMFTGGTPPYRVLTTDLFHAPVSSPLPMPAPDNRFYFFADARYDPPKEDTMEILTVLDSQSRTATAKLNIRTTDPCPSNPLLVVTPESADFRITNILAFQIAGGPPPPIPPAQLPLPTVCFFDTDCLGVNSTASGVAKVVSMSATTINVQALKVGATLMTVETADKQRASVVINVLAQP